MLDDWEAGAEISRRNRLLALTRRGMSARRAAEIVYGDDTELTAAERQQASGRAGLPARRHLAELDERYLDPAELRDMAYRRARAALGHSDGDDGSDMAPLLDALGRAAGVVVDGVAHRRGYPS